MIACQKRSSNNKLAFYGAQSRQIVSVRRDGLTFTFVRVLSVGQSLNSVPLKAMHELVSRHTVGTEKVGTIKASGNGIGVLALAASTIN